LQSPLLLYGLSIMGRLQAESGQSGGDKKAETSAKEPTPGPIAERTAHEVVKSLAVHVSPPRR
jgi:hypothetical protein